MKKLLRLLALATLGLYVGLVATEAFHGLCKDHSDAHCVVCQVAHQTPTISQGRPVLQNPQRFRRLVSVDAPLAVAQAQIPTHGLSPPVL